MKRLSYILLSGLMLILSACEKDTESTNFAPVVTTGTASNIYRMGATLSGSIQLTETNTAQSYGILFSELESMAEYDEYPVKDGSTSYSVLIQNLEPGETYYYCAYASSGYSIAKSQIKSFTTTQSNAPVFNEVVLQGKDEKSCVVSVEILDEGGSDLLISGFVLGESGKGDPTATNNIKIQNVEPQGSKISATFSGLEPNKTYLVRAYGINASGTGYSNSISVTTNTATVPFLSDITRVDSTEVSVTVKASVLDAGLGDVTKYGFCYSSESKEPTTAHLVVENVEGNTDEFTALIENLNPETTYYFRAYAENEKGVGYSNVIEYTTKQVLIQGTEGDVHVEEAGGLSKFIDDTNKYNITKLKVSGYLNGDDIRLICEMAGRDVNGNETNGRLVDLDISEAMIVEGGGAYYGDSYYTSNDVVGERMFGETILKNLLLPSSAISIGISAFDKCSSLETISIPNGVTYIGERAFDECSSLIDITLPDGLKEINYRTFEDCSSLTSISIPESVTSIGTYAFIGCTSLVSINIPKGVTTIAGSTFYDCSSLTKIDIPDSVTRIGSLAFYGCSLLSEVTCNATTPPTLGSGAFTNIASSATLLVPVGCEDAYKTSDWANFFANITDGNEQITNLEITLSSAGTLSSMISEDDKYNIISLKVAGPLNGDDIRFICSMAGRDEYGSETSGSLIDLDISEATIVAGGSWYLKDPNTYTLFDTTNDAIGHRMFAYTKLENILLPNSVTLIQWGAFQDSPFLKSVTIPDGVTSIEQVAFARCSSLTSITIPDGVTMIEQDTFSGCSLLENVAISSQSALTSMGSYAFKDCSSLTSIFIPDGVTLMDYGVFYGCSSLTSVNIPNEVTKIDQLAFAGCSSLTSIHIPDAVTSIGSSAFYSCSSLIKINIPDGVSSIESSTFSGCKALASIVLPDVVTSIGDNAFDGCSSLVSIILPDGVTSMGGGVFRGCSSLTKINIPDGITEIAYNAFEYCSSLASINIPDGVTSIGSCAFNDCSSLTSIDMPASLTSIGNQTFGYCSSLTSIVIPSGVTTIDRVAFSGCSSLSEVICNASTPPTLGDNCFRIASPSTLIVPTGCSTAYSASDWAQYFTTIEEK